MQSPSSDRVNSFADTPHYHRDDPGQDTSQEPPRGHQRDIIQNSPNTQKERVNASRVILRPGVAQDNRDDSSSEDTDRGSCEGRSEAAEQMEEGSGTVPAAGIPCRLCSDGLNADEPVFRCPCRCPDVFIHRSCLEDWLHRSPEASCPTCGAAYPVRRRTKALWRWFWEKDSRMDAAVFLANVVFSLGNVVVLCMAWLYVLYEYKSTSRISAAALASALLALSLFWVAFGFVRFHVLFKTYTIWRRLNTTLKVLLADKTVDIPA
ncbi:E3 ubiquitin-protein ligase MARCHF3-like [Ixodes scapularis]|uniref:E3 ubiquitin-protein ligase MARCHF3-like n=1 Tax=Ixodes scapularis TaxID=6945 RepID=UPI001A9CCF8D|nr:E3 ubiquitin-protein ligase MARCHF3-like [Ixodes scapularis]